MKKVSIIIPAYNVDKYIHRALESTIGQTYKNIEIAVVDDGSTDETLNIVKKYASKDSRIIVIHQENQGVSSARNNGLEAISGDYLLFLDSDDWLEKDTVELMLQLAEKNIDKLICVDRNFAYFNNNDIYLLEQNVDEKSALLDKEKSLKCIVNHKYNLQSSCYKLFRRDIILRYQLSFNMELFHGEDGFFVFEYLNNINGLYYENLHLWNILDRENSATNSSFDEKWLTAIDAAKKMYNYPGISIDLKNELYKYLVERTLMVKTTAIKTRGNKKPIHYINEQLTKQTYKYIKSNAIFKRKLYFVFMTYFPDFITRKIIKYLNRKDKR